MMNPLSFEGDPYVPNISEHFTYSMMTVIDDQVNQKKYQYLEYVEFLEMICRIAHMHW